MQFSDQPERAEVSEITTNTLDGADSFILSHEISVGQFGIEAVTTTAKAIAEAENIYDYEQAYINVREDIKLQGVEA